MTLLGRMWRAISEIIGNLIEEKEDPETALEEAIMEMEERLVELRRAIAGAIASQKNIAKQLNEYIAKAEQWHDRARLALNKGNEQLAKEALEQRQPYQHFAAKLQTEIDLQNQSIARFKEDFLALENKINFAKAKKNMYQIRSKSANSRLKIDKSLEASKLAEILAGVEIQTREFEAYSQLTASTDPKKDLEN